MSNSRVSVTRERRLDIGPQASKEESEPVCQQLTAVLCTPQCSVRGRMGRAVGPLQHGRDLPFFAFLNHYSSGYGSV